METLAFIHSVVAYEDPTSQLRSIEEITSAIPTSALTGVVGAAIAVSILTHTADAQAAVRKGNVCAAVSTVQSTLQSKGYTVGGVDGAFGNNTEYAVVRFQSKNGLSADGIVGPSTASAMGLNSSISCGSSGGGGGSPGGGTNGNVTIVGAPSGLRIRSGPSAADSVLGYVYSGQIVGTTGARNNGFLQLTRGGWVSAQYTSAGGSGGGGNPGGGSGGGSAVKVIAANGVNIRNGPGTSYAVVGGAAYGQTLAISSDRRSANGYTWARLTGGVGGGWVVTAGLSN